MRSDPYRLHFCYTYVYIFGTDESSAERKIMFLTGSFNRYLTFY